MTLIGYSDIHSLRVLLKGLIQDEVSRREGGEETNELVMSAIIEQMKTEVKTEVSERKASDEFVLAIIEDIVGKQKKARWGT